MTPDPSQNHSGLRWIRAELDEILRLARRQLEDFVDGETEQLDECIAHLHHVHGSLEVIQVYGAAMLADEMESLAEALSNDEVTRKEAAAEVLMLGMVQLPAYLEKIEAGEPDIPLILLPLMNDLRASRLAPLVSEISLFAPKLDSVISAEEVEPGSGNPALSEIVREQRSNFHRGLLNWFRDIDARQGLSQMRDVVERVSAEARTSRIRRLMDASEALVVALQEDSIETSVAVKLLFGQLDRIFKNILDFGEEAAARDFPLDLLKNQLYYIARSESENPVVQAVRRSADLANSFPDVSFNEASQSGLGGPSKELFGAVSDALRDDLVSVKDQLDLYIRGDHKEIERLVSLADPIQRIGDTLGMVGRGELRSRLKPHCDHLREISEENFVYDEDQIMALAGDLLFVESSLSGLADIPEQIIEERKSENNQPVLQSLSDGEYQEHLQAAIDQGFVELAKTKDGVLQYLGDSQNIAVLQPLSDRLHIVSGALTILAQPMAAGLLEDFGGYIKQLAKEEREVPDDDQREALADLVSGVEYYMEALVEGRSDRDHALNFAESAARRLGLREVDLAEDGEIDVVELEAIQQIASADKPALDDIDSEILDIFVEEAREEIEAINEQYPHWRENSEDNAALTIIRRSFHTLKGSGRLVGASHIGEFAWSIENLLNRVIDGSISVSHDIYSLLDDVVEILPSLVNAFEQDGAEVISVEALVSRAEQLAHPEMKVAEEVLEETTQLEDDVEVEQSLDEEIDLALGLDEEGDLTLTLDEEQAADESEEFDLSSEELILDSVADDSHDEIVLDSDSTLEDLGLDESLNSVSDFSEEVEDSDISSLLEDQLTESDSIESILVPKSEEIAPIALESVLHDIFANESATHLKALEEFIENCRGLATGCVFNDELRRALHTLRGSSHMAQVQPMALLSGAFEKWANLASQLELRTEPASIDLLERGHFVLTSLLSVINQAGASLPAWQPLLQEVEALADDLEKQVAGAEVVSEFNEESHDAEIIEIFLEEVHELSDEIESAFEEWQQRPDDLLPVTQLQRSLHTIKGGARLAGISNIGDLSHGLESVFESISERRIEGTSAVRGLARHAMDALASQIEALQHGQPLAEQQGMVDRLEAAARGDSWQTVESVPDLLEDTSMLVVEKDEAKEEPVDLPSQMVDESTFLSDSNLLTDSELLSDSNFIASSLLSEESLDASVGSILHDDSRIIQFPGSERKVGDGEETVLREAPPPEVKEEKTSSQETVRVRADLLDNMVNNAGEVSIYRARLEQQNKTLSFNLDELNSTIERLAQQLRGMDIETEAQILSRHEREFDGDVPTDFDPLEMDRYSTIQQLSRALSETVNDLGSIGGSLQDLSRDTDTLLLQQARVTNDLQDGLLHTRMVPFSSRTARLQRVVRQTSHSLDKLAELSIVGGEGEMDRAILERMMAPIEHLLRNAVAHGIEEKDARKKTDKNKTGIISLSMERDGADVVLSVSDDGQGLNRDLIREKAIERGLLDKDVEIDDEDIDQLILEAGFSTADAVSQISGRGVGLDVVLSEVKQLGGTLEISSQPGRGTSFSIRLPFTLAITEALLVQSGDEIYAVAHGSMDGVVRISREELEANYRGERDGFEYGGREYTVRYLGTMLGNAQPVLPEGQRWFPILLVRSGEHRVAIHVNGLLGNRQIVVKTVGAQLSTVRWFTGGTILADGQIALILDVNSLVRMDSAHHHAVVEAEPEAQAHSVKVMVVDDSITVRKVTSRLLERHNMSVITAKDGVDAVAVLQDEKPDVMLLDIEMPRMDGFELARHMRSSEELSHIPIIMITSRSGDKHRNHALELGVKRYLGKPFQEADLLENIYTVLAEV